MDKKELYEMLTAPSPNGGETDWQKKMISRLQECTDRIITDSCGDFAAVINESSDYRVMLAAHADEICLRVYDADSDGFLKVVASGGVESRMYPGHQVSIITPDKTISGAVVADHNLYSDKEATDQLRIDIGATDRSAALQAVPHGSFVVFDSAVSELLNNRFAGRALDDRIGVYVVSQAVIKARQLKASVMAAAVSDVGEETGSTGTYYMASLIKPDIAIVVDVTYASDYPSADGGKTGTVRVGGGPVIDHGSRINPAINRRLAQVAASHGISLQYEMTSGYTGTDADRLTFANKGIPFALVSIPLRNMHSPAEVASWDDIESCIDLLAYFLAEIDSHFDCSPFNCEKENK